MHRRTFVRVVTAGGVTLLAAPHLTGCRSLPSTTYEAWNGPSSLLADEDIRLRIVAYGLLAPSAANLQPWWVSIKQPGILIALEPQRLLPISDPDLHATYVSHGAFLEALRLAAGNYGLRTTTTLFPFGEPTKENDFRSAVARLDLTGSATPDPLAAQLIKRRTNREPFRPGAVAVTVLKTMTIAAGPDVTVHWFVDREARDRIAEAVVQATSASLSDPERFRETLATIRWSDEEIESHRDGIPLGQLGFTTWERFVERFFGTRIGRDGDGSSERLVEATRRQASTASAFGVLTTATNGREAELAAGAAMLRVHLSATALGLAFQPMNAPLEGQVALPTGLLPVGTVPHLLFRVGTADAPSPAPRRTLFEVVQL